MLIGAFSIGNASPNIQNLAAARGAAYTIYQIIDMVSVLKIGYFPTDVYCRFGGLWGPGRSSGIN